MEATLSGRPATFEGGLRPVAPGTWAWLQPDGGWGEANAGLVVGDGASAVIDTLWDEGLAATMLAAMGAPTAAAPIALAVNTHHDGDHWWGNARLPADARIVTSQRSLDAMRHEGTPADLSRLRRLAGLTARIPGRPGAMGRYVRSMLAPFAFDDVTLRFPDDAFSGRATEHVGGRALELVEVGPAHTPGDLVVYLPDVGVVFAADVLFVGVTPVMWEGPVENWIAALDTVLGFGAETIVPGHGPLSGPAEVRALRDYWVWLAAAVAEHHAAGRSPLQATLQIVRSPEFAPYRGWLHPERAVINVTTIHRALSGQGPLAQTPPVRIRLFDQVATVARAIERG
jgi:glyoxylase-like metal-dependent hydrolase (beta-lactamase superfamily II)